MNNKKPVKTKGKANPIDVHVGQKLKARRILLGISQEKLADRCGVTFQQVQKYETGANRTSASMLFTLASILEVPLDYFFAGLEFEETGSIAIQPVKTDKIYDLISDKEVYEVAFQYAMLKRENPDLVKPIGSIITRMFDELVDISNQGKTDAKNTTRILKRKK